ncbi:Glycoside hydrolase and Glycosyl hydrolases 38 domain containing protein [Aphelenchoides besseyi]|nr:Glycoside hydrolase and Glycosyl hydrolases 38 domain containing protein [Aphelenchoides besseyi]
MAGRAIPPQVFFAVGLSVFVFVSFLLYATVDTNARVRQDTYSGAQNQNVHALRRKIEDLEKQLKQNDELVNNLERKWSDDAKQQQSADAKADPDSGFAGPKVIPPPKPPSSSQIHENQQDGVQIPLPKDANQQAEQLEAEKARTTPPSAATCAARNAKSDIQMLDAYDKLPFDNPDGGVWKQGFEITYDKQKIQQEKRLEVVVIPHSHCDPGWIKTFEDYYRDQTQHILNGMLTHLDTKKDMKFIYAEMSFFELWWSKLTDDQKEKVKSYLKSGQFEIVTGGWVMTDEANAHHFAIIMELIEGHEFLLNHLDYRPENHWSIDPFGLSSTLAKVIKSANLTHMAIQRVHYSIKRFLAETKQLEFRWRQFHAAEGADTDIRTHMFPFYSYDVPHTCGPDPAICCTFDFKRLTSMGCPWRKSPQRINDRNVAARAQVLADQYRKKAQLYKMNTLLIPLGDDFRYDTDVEWEDQYSNYKQLFDYMNSKSELNIHARFGTLKDYFNVLDERLNEETDPADRDLPILSGDFFTYADRDDHYWSGMLALSLFFYSQLLGYFTSRPFYKHMDRTVQHFVRTADLLYSLAQWSSNAEAKSFTLTDDYDQLVKARRSLALFQHHDGVTGTAKPHVVTDYGHKMLTAINDSVSVAAKSAAFLLNLPQNQKLELDHEYRLDELPVKLKTQIGSTVVLHNSLAHSRDEVVCLRVDSVNAHIRQSDSQVEQQIQPTLISRDDEFTLDDSAHDLCFRAQIPALGFARYEVVEGVTPKAEVWISSSMNEKSFVDAKTIPTDDQFQLSNDHLTANFDSKSGYLQSIDYKGQTKTDIQMEFIRYGARSHNSERFSKGGDSLSGAYLFLPDGPAKSLDSNRNSFVKLVGPVRQTLFLKGPEEAKLLQEIRLDSQAQSLEIVNNVDIRSESNFEFAMKFTSDSMAQKDEQLYTDLNGFQMIRRKRYDKLPLQAHFYPMAAAAVLEANNRRLTLLGRQALGVGSLQSGQLEVMLDRRLAQDDDRGLGEGVTDNLRTESRFRLFIEPTRSATSDSDRSMYLSLLAQQSSLALHYPIDVFRTATTESIPSTWTPLKGPLPCDVHLFAFRTLSQPTEYSLMGERKTKPRAEATSIFQRYGADCATRDQNDCRMTSDQFLLSDLFQWSAKSYTLTTLTGLYENQKAEEFRLDPMDLKAVRVQF